MVAGTVSVEQADVIARTVHDLPGAAHLRRRVEKLLVRHARVLDATELGKAARHLVTVVDPDGVDRRLEAALDRDERAAHADRYLRLTDDRAGGVRVTGRGSAEDGAVLRAALLPLTCPRPALDEHLDDVDDDLRVRDPRDGGARLWHALVQTAQHALDAQVVPDSHGTPAG